MEGEVVSLGLSELGFGRIVEMVVSEVKVLERRIRLEGLGKVLRTLRTDEVARKTDGGEGSIRLEEVSHNLCALHLQLVTTQAAKRESNGRVRGC